jgi:hypothetical protein
MSFSIASEYLSNRFDNNYMNTLNDATPSTSTEGSSFGESPRVRRKSFSSFPLYDSDSTGPPNEKMRRLSPTVGEIPRADRHQILFGAMVAPSRSRMSSPVRRLLANRDPCASGLQSAEQSNNWMHNVESKFGGVQLASQIIGRLDNDCCGFRGYEDSRD